MKVLLGVLLVVCFWSNAYAEDIDYRLNYIEVARFGFGKKIAWLSDDGKTIDTRTTRAEVGDDINVNWTRTGSPASKIRIDIKDSAGKVLCSSQPQVTHVTKDYSVANQHRFDVESTFSIEKLFKDAGFQGAPGTAYYVDTYLFDGQSGAQLRESYSGDFTLVDNVGLSVGIGPPLAYGIFFPKGKAKNPTDEGVKPGGLAGVGFGIRYYPRSAAGVWKVVNHWQLMAGGYGRYGKLDRFGASLTFGILSRGAVSLEAGPGYLFGKKAEVGVDNRPTAVLLVGVNILQFAGLPK